MTVKELLAKLTIADTTADALLRPEELDYEVVYRGSRELRIKAVEWDAVERRLVLR